MVRFAAVIFITLYWFLTATGPVTWFIAHGILVWGLHFCLFYRSKRVALIILLWVFVLKDHIAECRRLRLHNAFNLIILVGILPLPVQGVASARCAYITRTWNFPYPLVLLSVGGSWIEMVRFAAGVFISLYRPRLNLSRAIHNSFQEFKGLEFQGILRPTQSCLNSNPPVCSVLYGVTAEGKIDLRSWS